MLSDGIDSFFAMISAPKSKALLLLCRLIILKRCAVSIALSESLEGNKFPLAISVNSDYEI